MGPELTLRQASLNARDPPSDVRLITWCMDGEVRNHNLSLATAIAKIAEVLGCGESDSSGGSSGTSPSDSSDSSGTSPTDSSGSSPVDASGSSIAHGRRSESRSRPPAGSHGRRAESRSRPSGSHSRQPTASTHKRGNTSFGRPPPCVICLQEVSGAVLERVLVNHPWVRAYFCLLPHERKKWPEEAKFGNVTLVSRDVPVEAVRAGPRSALPATSEASMNSFMRRVGVPSMQECSPRKPDLPFSKTMTAYALTCDG